MKSAADGAAGFRLTAMRLAHKMAIVGLMVATAVAVPTSLYLSEVHKKISFSARELQGTPAIQTSGALVRSLQMHRVTASVVLTGQDMAAASTGGTATTTAAITRMQTVRQDILRQLTVLHQQLEHEPALKRKLVGVQQAFDLLRKQVDDRAFDAQTCLTRHHVLIDDAIDLLQDIGDTYNLTLDPDVDSYYLMSAVVFSLPLMMESAGQLRGIGTQALVAAQGQNLSLDRQQIGAIYAKRELLLVANDAVKAGLNKTIAVTPQVEPRLRGAMQAIERASRHVIAQTDAQLLRPERSDALTAPRIDPQRYFADTTHAIDTMGQESNRLLDEFQALVRQRVDQMARERMMLIGLLGALVVGIGIASVWIMRSIVRRTHHAVQLAERIASGQLDQPIDVRGRDEVGRLQASLAHMQNQLREQWERERATSAENLRVRLALEYATVPSVLVDAQGRIVFINDAARALWLKVSGPLSRKLPQFKLDQMLGAKLADCLDDQVAISQVEHPAQSAAYGFACTLADRSIQVSMAVVRDEGAQSAALGQPQAQLLGRVYQFQDRTDEDRSARDIAAVVQAASVGRFDQQIDLDGKEGLHRNLAEGVNALTQAVRAAINEVGAVVGALSQGDLTQRVHSEFQGELGQLKRDVNASVDRVAAIVEQIRLASTSVAAASSEIAQGSQDLSNRTERTAVSLQQTASSLEELTSSARQSSAHAQRASELARHAMAVATQGGVAVDEVVQSMRSIAEASKRIGDIIGVIDGIAFQTNILALNAAVEAARAGDQGRGFAVVASEVRSLAQRSASAAREIKGLIQDSVGRVDQGAQQVDVAGRTMAQIVDSVQGVTDLVAEMAAASQQQSSGIEQINIAVTQMDGGTQQNAALVEEAAASAHCLLDQARRLEQLVDLFQHAEPGLAGVATPLPRLDRGGAADMHAAPGSRSDGAAATPGWGVTGAGPAAQPLLGSKPQDWSVAAPRHEVDTFKLTGLGSAARSVPAQAPGLPAASTSGPRLPSPAYRKTLPVGIADDEDWSEF